MAKHKQLRAKTLFATHYHELSALEDELDSVKNYNIAVKKRGDDITFLRRIIRGGANHTYGIEVAKLAGIPEIIVSRARQVLKALEEGGEASAPPERNNQAAPAEPQLSFASAAGEELLEELKHVDVNVLSPIEALGNFPGFICLTVQYLDLSAGLVCVWILSIVNAHISVICQ